MDIIEEHICSLFYLVVHLFWAVEHIHHDAQGASKVFSGLRFTSASWTRGGTTHSQMKRLGQGYVTPEDGRVKM